MKLTILPGQFYTAKCEATHPQFIVLDVREDIVDCEFRYQCGSREYGTMTIEEIGASYALRRNEKRNGKV